MQYQQLLNSKSRSSDHASVVTWDRCGVGLCAYLPIDCLWDMSVHFTLIAPLLQGPFPSHSYVFFKRWCKILATALPVHRSVLFVLLNDG